jgi:hypothetical protein
MDMKRRWIEDTSQEARLPQIHTFFFVYLPLSLSLSLFFFKV